MWTFIFRMCTYEDRIEHCKNAAAAWLQKRKWSYICRLVLALAVGYLVLLAITQYIISKRGPQQEGKRYMTCTPSEDTYLKFGEILTFPNPNVGSIMVYNDEAYHQPRTNWMVTIIIRDMQYIG